MKGNRGTSSWRDLCNASSTAKVSWGHCMKVMILVNWVWWTILHGMVSRRNALQCWGIRLGRRRFCWTKTTRISYALTKTISIAFFVMSKRIRSSSKNSEKTFWFSINFPSMSKQPMEAIKFATSMPTIFIANRDDRHWTKSCFADIRWCPAQQRRCSSICWKPTSVRTAKKAIQVWMIFSPPTLFSCRRTKSVPHSWPSTRQNLTSEQERTSI